jgi:hypothetical protein
MNANFMGMHVKELTRQASILIAAMSTDRDDIEARREAVKQVLVDDDSEEDNDLRDMVESLLTSMPQVATAMRNAA